MFHVSVFCLAFYSQSMFDSGPKVQSLRVGELWFSKSIDSAVQTLEMIRSDGFDRNIY